MRAFQGIFVREVAQKEFSQVTKDEYKEQQERSSCKIQLAREINAKDKKFCKLCGG